MKVLLIKTSSMGDLIHTLPALTDAGLALPGIQFDWLVEESFTSIPKWHPLVHQVIPVALRRWRKGVFSPATRTAWGNMREQLRGQEYDLVLDAQGLVKSAFISLFTRGTRVGLDWRSAREPLASLAYQRKCKVNFYQHAVVRMRSLFSQALDYPLPTTGPHFGLDRAQFQPLAESTPENYIVFLHGTTWTSKQWPERYWIELSALAARAGYRIKMSCSHPEELARAERIAKNGVNIDLLPHLNITQMAQLLANAQAAVAVDTGLGHLAAALNVPTVSIYGPTNPEYTGALGPSSLHVAAKFPCAPCLGRVCKYVKPAEVTPACYTTTHPVLVWQTLGKILG
jgi:heptosyltransferase-1